MLNLKKNKVYFQYLQSKTSKSLHSSICQQEWEGRQSLRVSLLIFLFIGISVLHFIQVLSFIFKNCQDFWITKAPVSCKFLVNLITALQIRVFSIRKQQYIFCCLSAHQQLWQTDMALCSCQFCLFHRPAHIMLQGSWWKRLTLSFVHIIIS